MTKKSTTLFALAALAASLATAGCQKSARQQQEEAVEARRDLEDTRREAQSDVAEAERRAREAAAETRREAQKDVADAEKRAREATAEARGATGADAVLAPNRNDYLKKQRDDLAAVDRKIDALEARAANATGKAKADLSASAKRLREQRAAVGRQLDKAGTVADATWSSFAASFDKAVNDLETAVDRATDGK
jgi:small-conductance mechanosensitive channel